MYFVCVCFSVKKNSIGPEGVKKIAEALKKNQILQDLKYETCFCDTSH